MRKTVDVMCRTCLKEVQAVLLDLGKGTYRQLPPGWWQLTGAGGEGQLACSTACAARYVLGRAAAEAYLFREGEEKSS